MTTTTAKPGAFLQTAPNRSVDRDALAATEEAPWRAANAFSATLAADALARLLTAARWAITKHPAIPVLSCVVLEHDGSRLLVRAFDYGRLVEVAHPCAGSPGRVVVAAERLARIARAQGRGTTVQLALGDAPQWDANGPSAWAASTRDASSDRGLVVSTALATSTLVLSADEQHTYPATPSAPASLGALSPATMAALSRVAVCASDDFTLPVLTALRLRFDGTAGTVTAAATDRYRLRDAVLPFTPAAQRAASRRAPASTPRDLGDLLVPVGLIARAVSRWGRIAGPIRVAFQPGEWTALPGYRDAVTAPGTLFLHYGGETIAAQLVEAQFPKVEGLWPEATAPSVTLDRRELLAAITRAAALRHGNSNDPVKLRLVHEADLPGKPVRLHLAVDTADGSTTTHVDALDVEGAGDRVLLGDFALNPTFLAQLVGSHTGDRIVIAQPGGPSKPAILTSVPHPPEDGSIAAPPPADPVRSLLMPIRMAG